MSEFEVIRRLLRDAPALRDDVIIGPGDDAAVLALPANHELVLTTDTLICGRHFPVDTKPADIGWKSLAVNLSDLAAMAADPAWITIALSLPQAQEEWLAEFVTGLFPLLQSSGAALVGGDLTHGDLSITVQAAGLVPSGQALRRDSAQVGDKICVTGDLGDAALGLNIWLGKQPERDLETKQPENLTYVLNRLTRPQPRCKAGIALRGRANAGVDISDGLAADLGHMLKASNVGARLYADSLPSSEAFDALCEPEQRLQRQLNGGDDYELCVTVPDSELAALRSAIDCKFTVIGEVVDQPGLQLLDANQQPMEFPQGGYDHFPS